MGDVVQGLGHMFQDTASAFTPQNDFKAYNPLNQQAFMDQIGASQNNLQGNLSQQQTLADALRAQSQGQGPNPAQAMLNQATDKNIAQNTGMIASQKGINPALAARLAGQNAGQMNQQAAGQGAVMGAQQQLASQGQLAGVYSNMANQNLNNINTSANAVNTAVNGVNQANAAVASQNAAANQATTSGLMGGIGQGAMALAAMSRGGMVPHFADGGMSSPFSGSMSSALGSNNGASAAIAAQIAAQAGIPSFKSGVDFSKNQLPTPGAKPTGQSNPDVYAQAAGADPLGMGTLPGVQATPQTSMLGVPSLTPVPQGPSMLGTLALRGGGSVPGRAQVAGDSPKNDTVPAVLSPGEIVIPRSSATDPEKAKEFVAHLLKQKESRDQGFGRVLDAHRQLGEHLKALKGAR